MPDVLKDLSTARIERSRDCLREAKLLLDNGEYRGAANRAYYAAFHALRAVLALDDFDSKSTPASPPATMMIYIASKADMETQYQRAEKLVAEIER